MSINPLTIAAQKIWLTALAVAAACLSGASGNSAPAALASTHETFLENGGQWDGHARYLMQGNGVHLWLTQDGPRYQFVESKPMVKKPGDKLERHRSFTLQLSFIGGRALNLNAFKPVPGVVNFIDTSGKSKHQITGLHRYEAVEATDVYPGINARFTSTSGVPRYDLIVKPGADPSRIHIRFDGVQSMRRRSDGAIELATPLGTLQHKDLFAFQGSGANQKQVPCTMSCEGNTLHFHPGKYDHSKPLVIDPVLVGSYFGTGNETLAKFGGILGRVFLAGTTSSMSFPVSLGLGGQGTITGNTVGFVSVLSSNLRSTIYSTYIGSGFVGPVGNITEQSASIQDAVMDSQGRIDLALHTHFTPIVSTFLNEDHLELIQLDNSGLIAFSDFIVASGINLGRLVLGVSPSGTNIGIGFMDEPSDISATWRVLRYDGTTGSSQGATAIFLAKYDPGFGGIEGIDIDDQGRVVVAGFTDDPTYPTTNGAFQTNFGLGVYSGFVTLLNPNLSIKASTFLSGTQDNDGASGIEAVAFDRAGGVAVTGDTAELGFPVTAGAYQGTSGYSLSGACTFMTRFTPDLGGLVSSTFLGADGNEYGRYIQVNADNSVWIGGDIAIPTKFPIVNSADSSNDGPLGSSFIALISADATTNFYSTTWHPFSGFYFNELGQLYVGGVTSTSAPTTVGVIMPAAPGTTGKNLYVTGLSVIPTVTGLRIAPAAVYGGETAEGTVYLQNVAPPGGAVVNLSSNKSSVVVPATITIPAGGVQAVFTINTNNVSGAVQAAITAKSGASKATGGLRLIPGTTLNAKLSLDHTSVSAGNPCHLTVSLPAPTSTNLLVNLSSNNSGVTVPATATIPVGASGVTVPVTTLGLDAGITATLTANIYGDQVSTKLQVTPATLATFTIVPGSVISGVSAVGRFTLDGLAGSAKVFNLSSTSPFLHFPATVTIPAQGKTIAFPITTSGVAANIVGTIKATSGALMGTANLTVTPATLKNLVLTVSSVKGGTNATATVHLTGFAPVSGVVVTLNSNDTSATVPASVKILANTSALAFAVKTSVVTATKTVQLTATVGSTTVPVTLTITP